MGSPVNLLRRGGLVAIALFTLGGTALAGPPLRAKLGPQGDLLGWFVAGPYPNDGALQRRGTGFKTDYLGGEPDASPTESSRNGAFSWQLAFGTPAKGIDLKSLLKTDQPGIAYCFTDIHSPREQDAELLFGSDDGAKVYINGKLLFSKEVARGIKRDEEHFPIHLLPGDNRLLFKIEQGDGGWGLMARVVSRDGAAIPNIVQVLPIDPVKKDSSSILRLLAGKPGAISIAAFQSVREEEATANRFLRHLRSRAIRPDDLDRALRTPLPSPATVKSCEEFNRALVDKAVAIQVRYLTARSRLLKWAQNPGPISISKAATEDFVKVMPGGRYFVHADGRPFIPIGANHNPDWPELEQSDPLHEDYDPARTDRWFANLQRHGVDLIRLMVETPPSGNLEEKVGTFRPEHLIWLDNIFTAARRHNVKLWITPYDTFWMSLRADASPYWKANGGPIDKPIDFLTKPEIIAAQERRMKFLIDRYGNSGTVFAWEIMNEIDLWWGANPTQIKAWTDKVASYVRRYQRKRWGRDHLVTLSFAVSEPKDQNADTAFRRSDLDFATMHLYLGASRGPGPGEAEKAGEDFAGGVRYALSQLKDNRPVLDGESGPIDRWIKDEKLDNEVFHQMSWQHLMAGGAGPGTRWPYRNPHTVTAGMLDTLKAMRGFCDGVPWRRLTGPEVTLALAGPTGSQFNSFATAKGAIVWLRVPDHATTKKLVIKWRPQKSTRFRIYDVRRGAWTDEIRRSQSSAELIIRLPDKAMEVAIWVAR